MMHTFVLPSNFVSENYQIFFVFLQYSILLSTDWNILIFFYVFIYLLDFIIFSFYVIFASLYIFYIFIFCF